MSTPKSIAQEYARATAAEKALSDRIAALEHAVPPVIVPPPVITPPPPSQSVLQVSPTDSPTALLTAFGNLAYDVVELRGGTYKPGLLQINIDRTARPLTVRQAAGAAVIFQASPFQFGRFGVAAHIAFKVPGLVLDRYVIGDGGAVWMGNCHDMEFSGPVVQNATCVGTGPIYSWALYLSVDAGVSPQNVIADDWTVRGTSRNISTLQVGHPPSVLAHIQARRWIVDSVAYAIYAYDDNQGSVSDLQVSDWNVTNSVRAGTNDTVYFGRNVTGSFSNMHVGTGGLESLGGMTRGAGNVGL